LYVPLGGNRKGRVRTYVNLMLVMVLGGLWHGAAYTYIVWGAIHGVALAVERALGLQGDRGAGRFMPVRLAWFVVAQSVVLCAWVFFRSDSFANAASFLDNIAALDLVMPNTMMWVGTLFLLPLVLHHAWTWAEERGAIRPLTASMRAALAAVMVYGIVTLYAGTSDFIYFQF
jgi:alginate O-acetyltransferase complex protein AlgI